MKKSIVVIKQQGIKDCGASCLLSIIKYYKGNVPLEKLREMTKTDRNGVSAYHLIECAKEIGFSARGLKCKNLDELKGRVKLPCIAHLIINKSYKHYVVIYEINYSKKKIVYMDPNKGICKTTFDEFEKIWSKIIIDIFPIKKIVVLNTKNNIVNLIKEIFYSHKKLAINILVLSFFVTLFSIAGSYYFKVIIDKINTQSINNFYLISILFVILFIFKSTSDYFRNQLLLFINTKIDFSLMCNTFKHIICLPYDYFKNKTTGEIVSRINDLNYVREMIGKVSLTVFVDIILVLFSSFILFSINSILFFISLIIFVLYLIVIIFFSPIFKKNILENQQKQAEVNSYLIESINGFESIKALGIENNISSNLNDKYSNYLLHTFKINKNYNIQALFKDLIGGIGSIIIMFVGYLLVLDNKMSVGDLITYNALLIYFLEPIKSTLELEPLIRYSSSSIKRVNELYEIEKENLMVDKKYVGSKIKGDIVINDLNYTINDKDFILKDINLKINAGEKVMIMGDSGSGKSSLMKLLLNYSKIDRNTILIDDKDINDYNKKELRKKITYVSQNEYLFTDSIYNNIVLNKDVNYNRFLDIATFTEIDNIVKNKNLGYDTLLEENGFNVSGGEKGRIILARALLNEFDMLLLDEALNEMDINMERRILKRMFKKYKDKTIIIVSHRLENIDLFDKVIRISSGLIQNITSKESC